VGNLKLIKMENLFENFLIIDTENLFFHLNIAVTNVVLGYVTGYDSVIINTIFNCDR
jgi:hypothetical protein